MLHVHSNKRKPAQLGTLLPVYEYLISLLFIAFAVCSQPCYFSLAFDLMKLYSKSEGLSKPIFTRKKLLKSCKAMTNCLDSAMANFVFLIFGSKLHRIAQFQCLQHVPVLLYQQLTIFRKQHSAGVSKVGPTCATYTPSLINDSQPSSLAVSAVSFLSVLSQASDMAGNLLPNLQKGFTEI